MTATPLDTFERPLRSLRISVTDRCNLRCAYCMPEEEYTWLPKADLLDFEEVRRLAQIFAGLGVDRIRLTGGEPLLRRNLAALVSLLANVPGIDDVALTTNGVHLADQAADLHAAGLRRVTISIDSLQPDRFAALSGRDRLAQTLEGIAAAAQTGFAAVKLNTVVLRDTNDDELIDLLEFARGVPGTPVEVRFIEYMDVGGATRWSQRAVVSRQEILTRLAEHYGPPTPVAERGSAPAARYRLPDGTMFGVISSTTQPFCRDCDRARITADGRLFRCLYARDGIDLRGPLRAGDDDAALAALVRGAWEARTDRGAEVRLGLDRRRKPLALAGELRDDPHLEMHTRGG